MHFIDLPPLLVPPLPPPFSTSCPSSTIAPSSSYSSTFLFSTSSCSPTLFSSLTSYSYYSSCLLHNWTETTGGQHSWTIIILSGLLISGLEMMNACCINYISGGATPCRACQDKCPGRNTSAWQSKVVIIIFLHIKIF